MLLNRSRSYLALLFLVQACAGPRSVEFDEPARVDPVPASFGQFVEMDLKSLTALRYAQGRPAPLTIEVFVESPKTGALTEVGIRLRHRDGEAEPFDLNEPAGANGFFGERFELLVTNSLGEVRTSSAKREYKCMEWMGCWRVLHFVPGSVWGAGAIPEVRGVVVPPPFPRWAEPHLVSPFPLRGYEWDPPLVPGPYTLIVRLHDGSFPDQVTIDSDPVDILILE